MWLDRSYLLFMPSLFPLPSFEMHRPTVWAAHNVALVPAQPDWRLIPKSALDDRTGSLEFE